MVGRLHFTVPKIPDLEHTSGSPGPAVDGGARKGFVSAHGRSAPGEPLEAAGSVLAGGSFEPEDEW